MTSMAQYKIFGFINKVLVKEISRFCCNALESISMNNQECRIRA